jgi:hypothetical protein
MKKTAASVLEVTKRSTIRVAQYSVARLNNPIATDMSTGNRTEFWLSGTNQKSASECPGSQVAWTLSAGQVGKIKSPVSLQKQMNSLEP